MENLITRYRNVTILVAVLFAQVLGLAVQVKRSTENEPTRLIRIWAVNAVTPFEKVIVWCQHGTASLWHNYFYLRGVRQENRDLKAEIQRLRIEQVRLSEDAEQAHRLQALLAFREQFISKTVAAQVIGSSGSEQSRSIYIDKGAGDGIKADMAVITSDGVVGKVLRVYNSNTAQVLLIDDQTSGVGAILEKSRLQGVLRGTPAGEVVLEKVMSDEAVQPGEAVLTSGGDRIFPKGLPVGTVSKVSPGSDFFLNIRVKPAANLSKLEEVLVVTSVEEKEPAVNEAGPMRAADILAQRLPSVPEKPATDASKPGATAGAATIVQPPPKTAKPGTAGTTNPKPSMAGATQSPAGGPTAKPKANDATVAARPANAAPVTTKPANGTTLKPENGAAIKPATEQKPAPPPVKVSDQMKAAGNKAEPTLPKPKPQPAEPQSEPAPPEDKPH
ncbi:MAG: rod shape-determining protein MreC [Acidobacteriia bacterium]|nr:rod shape-determining protein MreC [Terriglobia bacterium]